MWKLLYFIFIWIYIECCMADNYGSISLDHLVHHPFWCLQKSKFPSRNLQGSSRNRLESSINEAKKRSSLASFIYRWFQHLAYPFDYFYEGGFPSGYFTDVCFDSPFYLTSVCQLLRIWQILVATNIFDILVLTRIAMKMKSQTISVTDLLTPKALKERKR